MNHEVYANPNENYQILINILSSAKEIYLSKTTRRYNKRKAKKEKWMTNELLQQINKKMIACRLEKLNQQHLKCIIIKRSTLKHLKR